MTIHWIGTGLSAIPGLRRLIREGRPVVVWNRTEAKAREAVGDLTDDIRAYSPEALAGAVTKGDIIVSMLPADQHVALARMAIDKGARFVSSSYIAPEMAALDAAAKAAGVAVVNEVGLDPGIDHIMAHELVADYRQMAKPGDVISFTSYCGGVPKYINTFRYKFSWSPLGVLRALRSPSRSIRGGETRDVSRPWLAVETYDAPLPTPERFEVYPNRDSLPFLRQYGFDPAWQVDEFVRGTIRLKGWKEAWTPVFEEIETLQGEAGEARLRAMAEEFWRANAYAPGEADRVVLFVALKAERDGKTVWHKEWVLDAHGDRAGSAMAKLVSVPVALAVEAVADGRIAPGVHAAPEDPELVAGWLVEVGQIAQHLAKVNHLKA
ncbi:saccharopine dehydrogenase C-terminal domain-containing protein [uncultured Paracoccus sp.]|uniref:saccharopine dehydrogenase C-terminal domain-containing protein n=1 Tax=uncultured Paracoccus sp. TaxID=189685 RepID=UPI00262889A9|nr:saccharopine dehydrogenase C-terminal domain-containing protein [uncultured Paracoccus sp.]